MKNLKLLLLMLLSCLPVLAQGNVGKLPSSSSSTSSTAFGLDVTAHGVTCDGVTDDTTAWNSLFSSIQSGAITQKTILIPAPCPTKVTSTVLIQGITQMQLICMAFARGTQTDAGTSCAFLWYGASGGTVIDIDRTQDSLFKNLVIKTDAGPNQANIGLVIDQTTAFSTIATDNTFERLTIYETTNKAAFKGVVISPVSGSNVENMKFYDLVVNCGASARPANGGIGIEIGNSSNAKTEQFYHAQVAHCTNALHQLNGSFQVLNWQDEGNAIGFKLANWAEPQTIQGVNEEAAGQFLVTTGHAVDGPLTVIANRIDSNLSTGVPTIDASQTFNLIFIGNKVEGTADTVFANTDGDNANLLSMDNHYTGSAVCTMAQYNSFHLGFTVNNDKWEGGNSDCPGTLIPFMISSSVENGGSGRTSSHAVDFRAAGYTSPFQSGSSLPATCVALIDWFFLNSGSVGLYRCSATNTWLKSGN